MPQTEHSLQLMRRYFYNAMLLCAALMCGCAAKKAGTDSLAGDTAAKTATTPTPRPASKPRTTPPKPQPKPPETPKVGEVTPLDVLTGRVVSANDSLRFVVLDFLPGRLPPLEKRLGIYRQGQKVGEVKITGPARENTIAADLLTGEAKPGDEARSD